MNLKKLAIALFVILRVDVMAFEVQTNGICQIEGKDYPAIGFGTFPLKDESCLIAATQAADLGYRIIDTATFYDNFEPIGQLLKRYDRQNFYIISKVWPNAQTPELLHEDLKLTLERLQTNYVDAYLLHWPNSKIPVEQTLYAMEALRVGGFIRHIGLSNVTVNHLKKALKVGVPITWVQVEMNPYFYDPDLLEFCQSQSITVQAWAPLGRGRINSDLILKELGMKYGKTAAQIAIRWVIQHGCIPLPGSQNIKHIQQNIDVADFELLPEEMHTINERARRGVRERVKEEAGLGFTDEFDFSYEQCWPKENVKSSIETL